MWNRVAFAALVLTLPMLAGCGSHSPSPPDKPAAAEPQVPIHWIEEGIEHEGSTISLGYRGKTASIKGQIEPIAAITRTGKPVADAMVFVRLVSADSDEAATVYEPSAGSEDALYSPGKLKLREGASQCAVRFRIVLPDVEQDWTREVEIPLQ